MRTITIEAYDPSWEKAFLDIKAFLEEELKDNMIKIEHIGSTSVIGLASKPIIDIDIVIDSYDVFPDIVKGLNKLGYTHNGDQGIKDREAFKYKTTQFMTHHLYVCPKDSLELKKHILFRDYLRSHSDALNEYESIKVKAALEYPHDIDGYLDMKGLYILKIYKKLGL